MAKENIKPNEVLAPTLFVGVGGIGSDIVKRVAELGKNDNLENVSFVCLDTNVNDLSNIASSDAKIYYVQTSTTQTVGDFLNYDEDALNNWFPKNAVIYDKTVSEGAGQVRAISRLALNACIKTGRIQPLYKAIDELYLKDGAPMEQAMRVVIVSSASGGTGSGIITPLSMLIRDYIKYKYPNASALVRALLLLPETLDAVIKSSSEKESQRRNAYATIKEINAFMMKGSGFFEVDEDLKRYEGLSIDFTVPGTNELKTLGLLPFDFCFLMDGQNAEDKTMINLGQYKAQAAQALYAQNIGPMQKKAFSIEDNIIKEMSTPGMYGRNRFGGIGASVLRYPYDDVVKYISYDWAIDAIGGEGEAAKWTKIDKEFAVKLLEAKKKGLPENEWPKRGEFYVDKVNTASDPFYKTLYSSFLTMSEVQLNNYFTALNKAINDAVDSNTEIQNSRGAANHLAEKIDYSQEKNLGKAVSNKNYLRNYEKCVMDNVKKLAISAAESIFQNETKTAQEKRTYTLEYLMKNLQDEIMHPNAMRYMLYKAHSRMKKALEAANSKLNNTILPTLMSYSPNANDPGKFDAGFTKDAREKNLDQLCKTEKKAGQDPNWREKRDGYQKIYDKLNASFMEYHEYIGEYAKKAAEVEAYKIGVAYLDELCKKFEAFYNGFKMNVSDLTRKQSDLVDSLKFRKGNSILYVCSEEDLLKELSRTTRSSRDESAMLDDDLNGSIFDAIKFNVAFDREIANVDVVEEDLRVNIFEDILLDYFESSVRDTCRSIDLNIIEAIAMENRLKARVKAHEENGDDTKVFDNVSLDDNMRYIKEVLARGRRLAAAGVQKLRCEEDRGIELHAYHKSLDQMRNYRMSELLDELNGVDSVSRYDMHFFNALYNLTPDRLDKFACYKESETGEKGAGLYHNAYVKYSRDIGPDSTKGAVISTHIDKRWDNIAVMPELDFRYQQQKIMEIHQALIYGLIHKAISYRSLSQIAPDKRIYKYENSDERYQDLVVSNGTLCDEFYEILDALYISSSIVEDIKIIRDKKRKRDMTRNSNYKDTVFAKELAEFKLDCVHDGETSLFEIPMAYYNTLPNSKRYTSEISALVDAVIKTFRDELSSYEAKKDVGILLCENLTYHYNLLMDNYDKCCDQSRKVAPCDNPVLDIIFRKIRNVFMATPELNNCEQRILDLRARLK